jgi:hypothetical protein
MEQQFTWATGTEFIPTTTEFIPTTTEFITFEFFNILSL